MFWETNNVFGSCEARQSNQHRKRKKKNKTGHADDDTLSFDVTGKDVKYNHEIREQETQRA